MVLQPVQGLSPLLGKPVCPGRASTRSFDQAFQMVGDQGFEPRWYYYFPVVSKTTVSAVSPAPHKNWWCSPDLHLPAKRTYRSNPYLLFGCEPTRGLWGYSLYISRSYSRKLLAPFTNHSNRKECCCPVDPEGSRANIQHYLP